MLALDTLFWRVAGTIVGTVPPRDECLLIVAVVAYDYWTRRRVHAVSVWGGLFLALSFPGRIALGHTDAWLTFARWLVR